VSEWLRSVHDCAEFKFRCYQPLDSLSFTGFLGDHVEIHMHCICHRTLRCDVTSLFKLAFVSCNQFSTWIACIGFTLGFGGMFLKTWRVHKIFVNRTKKMVSELKNYVHNKLINLEANNTRFSLLVLGKERALDPRVRTKTSLSFVRERSGILIFVNFICYAMTHLTKMFQ